VAGMLVRGVPPNYLSTLLLHSTYKKGKGATGFNGAEREAVRKSSSLFVIQLRIAFRQNIHSEGTQLQTYK